jgi:hypothetical protein
MKTIRITIPEPCHEDWARMTQQDKGKFCSSCEKVVYDMSVMTDNEIVKLVNADKKICGRFRNDQLDRPMVYTIPLRARKPSWAIAASLLVGLTFLSCSEEPVVGEIEVPRAGTVCVVDTLDNIVDNHDTLSQINDSIVKETDVREVGKLEIVEPPEEVQDVFLGQPIKVEEPVQIMTSGTPYIHEEEPILPKTIGDTSKNHDRTSGLLEIENP